MSVCMVPIGTVALLHTFIGINLMLYSLTEDETRVDVFGISRLQCVSQRKPNQSGENWFQLNDISASVLYKSGGKMQISVSVFRNERSSTAFRDKWDFSVNEGTNKLSEKILCRVEKVTSWAASHFLEAGKVSLWGWHFQQVSQTWSKYYKNF